MQNLRLAFRTLFKSPFVTAVAVLSLALGIGANTAIYSLFDRVLLRPLPVRAPDGLVNLAAPGPLFGSTSCNQAGPCEEIFSYAMYRDLEASHPGLDGIAAHRLISTNVAFEGQTLNGAGMLVSGTYFPVLGVRPAAGRLFTEEDDRGIGAHYVAVLSHSFWQTHLGGRGDVVGQPIIVNGESMTIVGVAPEGFAGTTLGAQPMVFVPLSMRAQMDRGFDGFENRRNYWAYVFGRLAPGTSREQAAAALNTVFVPILTDVEGPLQEGVSETTLREFLARRIQLADGRRGQSNVHGEARLPMILLFATTGIVLLIACANIANLLLARGASRGMEMAVRLSIGANRRQVIRQLLTESCVLALLGGVASLVVTWWTMAGISRLLPPEAGDGLGLSIRPSMIVFAAALALATGFLFGLFPALHSTRQDLIATIRSSAGNLTVTRGAARFRTILVTAQIALSMTLLIVAGLFLRSLVNVSRVDLGQDIENVIAFHVSPELNGYDYERASVFFTRLEEELGALPGVREVTSSVVPVLGGDNWGSSVHVEGFQSGPDIDSGSRLNIVGPGFFSALRIPILAGREFTASDAVDGAKVAIVNEAFARKFGLGDEAVGKWMSEGGDDELDMQIVGLVRDAAYSSVKDEVPPIFFTPWRQAYRSGGIGALMFYLRTGSDPAPVLRAIPGAVAGLDPDLPVEDLKTLPQQVRENMALDRMVTGLSAAFAALATLLAAVGLYGVLAFSVARRTREIGIRMALGADQRRVRVMVLGQVGRLLAVGGTLGILAAIGLGRVAASILFGLDGADPAVVVAAAGVLSVFALAAGAIPAWRASRVAPIRALRFD